jgi:hypothetical protein
MFPSKLKNIFWVNIILEDLKIIYNFKYINYFLWEENINI